MNPPKELIDYCLSRYESGESVSQIAVSLDTDSHDIRLIMSKDRYRYDYAEFVRARRQSDRLQKIKEVADRIALQQIEKIERTIRSGNVSDEKICSDVDAIGNAVGFLPLRFDSPASDVIEDQDDNQLPFGMVVRKHYDPPPPQEQELIKSA